MYKKIPCINRHREIRAPLKTTACNYLYRECQVSDWKKHKEICNVYVKGRE